MAAYISENGGYLREPQAIADCQFCPYDNTNAYLASINTDYSNIGRNIGILVVSLLRASSALQLNSFPGFLRIQHCRGICDVLAGSSTEEAQGV